MLGFPFLQTHPWTKWFAWRPIRINGRLYWLIWVWRQFYEVPKYTKHFYWPAKLVRRSRYMNKQQYLLHKLRS